MFWCQDLDFIVILLFCVDIMQEFSCPSLPRQLRMYDCVRYKAALSMQTDTSQRLHRHAERREEKAGIKEEDVIGRTVSDRCKAASHCSGD